MRISDWSSDVCSSDLDALGFDSFDDHEVPVASGIDQGDRRHADLRELVQRHAETVGLQPPAIEELLDVEHRKAFGLDRSEGRRVGEKCVSQGRSRRSPLHLKKKKDEK